MSVNVGTAGYGYVLQYVSGVFVAKPLAHLTIPRRFEDLHKFKDTLNFLFQWKAGEHLCHNFLSLTLSCF